MERERKEGRGGGVNDNKMDQVAHLSASKIVKSNIVLGCRNVDWCKIMIQILNLSTEMWIRVRCYMIKF
jgi:hypothetical protein